jgi:hypothetical protein
MAVMQLMISSAKALVVVYLADHLPRARLRSFGGSHANQKGAVREKLKNGLRSKNRTARLCSRK